MKPLTFALAISCLMVSLALAGCSASEPGASPSPPATAAAPANAAPGADAAKDRYLAPRTGPGQ